MTSIRKATLGVCLLATLTAGAAVPAPAATTLPPIKHVFTIVLENMEMGVTYGLGQALWPYLARDLPGMGAFVPNYYGTGHNSLDNYIAMTSGQGPSPETQGDCEDATTIPATGPDANGQAIGAGCTYPAWVQSIASQLHATGKTWKAYMEGMDASVPNHPATCRGPFHDTKLPKSSTDFYRAKHDPFVYYHDIVDDQAYCDSHVVPFTGFYADLASASTTPNFSFISPDQCDDGHDIPCGNTTYQSFDWGPKRASDWLQTVVPKIVDSPVCTGLDASKGGDCLIVILFDEAIVPSSCCNEPQGANLGPNNNNGGSYGPLTPLASGGGQAGAILLSPFIAPHTVSLESYNHYSYLRSMEDLFGVDHLGYAAQDGLKPFGSDVYGGTVVQV